MEQIFRRVIDSNFSDLHGLTVDASIPVPEPLINEIIAAAIRGNDNIDYCKVSIHRENRVAVNLKTPLWPWPLELKLRLEGQMDFRGSPKIHARLENKVFLARIGSFLHALPPGIHIHEDQIVVEIEAFLSTPEQKRMLGLIRSVAIKTEEDKVMFDVKVKVDEMGE